MGRRGAHLPVLFDSHEEHSGKAALQNQRTEVNLPATVSYLTCFVKKEYRIFYFLTKASGTTGQMCREPLPVSDILCQVLVTVIN